MPSSTTTSAPADTMRKGTFGNQSNYIPDGDTAQRIVTIPVSGLADFEKAVALMLAMRDRVRKEATKENACAASSIRIRAEMRGDRKEIAVKTIGYLLNRDSKLVAAINGFVKASSDEGRFALNSEHQIEGSTVQYRIAFPPSERKKIADAMNIMWSSARDTDMAMITTVRAEMWAQGKKVEVAFIGYRSRVAGSRREQMTETVREVARTLDGRYPLRRH
jgi:hypothetical protein